MPQCNNSRQKPQQLSLIKAEILNGLAKLEKHAGYFPASSRIKLFDPPSNYGDAE